ncbi:MAG TPA: hypothetical protein VFJ85_12435 [Acidimicrobiales bacterium]|nr:hypothetical protein [Acidimicrobiales bacterium]
MPRRRRPTLAALTLAAVAWGPYALVVPAAGAVAVAGSGQAQPATPAPARLAAPLVGPPPAAWAGPASALAGPPPAVWAGPAGVLTGPPPAVWAGPDPVPLPFAAPPAAPLTAPIAPPVPAAPPPPAAVPPWLAQRAAEAEAAISYPWSSLGYQVEFLPERPGIRARTLRTERRIEVYARPSDPVSRTAFDLAHELGHAFDFTSGTEDVHAAWQAARGLGGREWYGCNACGDLATPAGDFAESFAAWQVGAVDFRSQLGPPPDERQIALLATLTQL